MKKLLIIAGLAVAGVAHAGVFPVWYSPVQLSVLPVGEAQASAAEVVARAAIEAGLRAEVDQDGSIGARRIACCSLVRSESSGTS